MHMVYLVILLYILLTMLALFEVQDKPIDVGYIPIDVVPDLVPSRFQQIP